MGNAAGRGRYRNDDYADLIARIAQLEARLSTLERTPQLGSAGVNSGGITIKGGGIDVRRFGDDENVEGSIFVGSDILINGEQGMALIFNRSESVPGDGGFDGNESVRISTVEGDAPSEFHTLELKDKTGNTFLSDTWSARFGIDHPRLAYAWNVPAYTTSTSATFAEIANAEWYMYHPHLRVRVLVNNDGGNVSEVQVRDNYFGGVLASYTSTAGELAYKDLICKRSDIAGFESNGNEAGIAVDHRRVSGAGTIRTRIVSMIGIDLSFIEPY